MLILGSSRVWIVWNLKLPHKLLEILDLNANETSGGFRRVQVSLCRVDDNIHVKQKNT